MYRVRGILSLHATLLGRLGQSASVSLVRIFRDCPFHNFLLYNQLSALRVTLLFIAVILYWQEGPTCSPWCKRTWIRWQHGPSRSELKTGGVFEYVRHPIYGGLLLLCFGIAIISNSPLADLPGGHYTWTRRSMGNRFVKWGHTDMTCVNVYIY